LRRRYISCVHRSYAELPIPLHWLQINTKMCLIFLEKVLKFWWRVKKMLRVGTKIYGRS
jgi:hypothetical protein